jgi:hypothetical protein
MSASFNASNHSEICYGHIPKAERIYPWQIHRLLRWSAIPAIFTEIFLIGLALAKMMAHHLNLSQTVFF